jgi:hypothetical protein
LLALGQSFGVVYAKISGCTPAKEGKMVNWNSVRKPFIVLVVVALLVACGNSAVETTPPAVTRPTSTASPTEARAAPAQSVAAATITPTSPATTAPATRPAILDAFPLSVGATWVYSVTVDDVVEYHWTGLVTETITASKSQSTGWIFQSDVQGHPFRTQPIDRSRSYVVLDEHVYEVPGDRDPMGYVATEGQSFGVSQILIWPLSVGQKWGPAEFLVRGDVYVWRVEAQESVSTPAGNFDGCYRLAFDWADSNQLAWFCAGIGFVRWETHHHGSRHDEVWELQEFQRAASQATLGLVVEEYPIVASGVYTPDRLEYTRLVSPTILARRSEWRGYRTTEQTADPNEVLARFGYRLAPMPGSLYDLYRGDKLIQSEVQRIGWVMVNGRGDDFALALTDRKGREFVLRPAGLEPWSQYAYVRPVLLGNDLVRVEKPADTVPETVTVRRGNKVVYTAPVSDRRTDDPVKGLWAWNDHWVLEVRGQVVIDGKSLNNEKGYDEIFQWQLVNGQPFYFFKKGNRIGVSYAGQVLPYQYDEVIHYRCCEPAMFNVGGNENMVWFHALRGGMWYYVEMGIYS